MTYFGDFGTNPTFIKSNQWQIKEKPKIIQTMFVLESISIALVCQILFNDL